MMRHAVSKPSGELELKVINNAQALSQDDMPPLSVKELFTAILPSRSQSYDVQLYKIKNFKNAMRGLKAIRYAAKKRIPTMYGILTAKVIHGDGSITDYGVISTRLVTTAGVNFIRDAFLTTTEAENMKYHGIGTGTNAEATGDTALQTELTTQYATDNTRPTGSQVSGGTGAYQTVATVSPDSGGTLAITEHGIFSQAATGGGTLLDRSVFSAINLVAGSDSIQTTYTITFSAGG